MPRNIIKMKYRNKNIVVLAELYSTGLWRKGKGCICGLMIGYDELDLPEKLIKEFEAWIEMHDKFFYKHALGDVKRISEKKSAEVNKESYRLSVELKKLFPDKNILMYQEDHKGDISGPVEIIN